MLKRICSANGNIIKYTKGKDDISVNVRHDIMNISTRMPNSIGVYDIKINTHVVKDDITSMINLAESMYNELPVHKTIELIDIKRDVSNINMYIGDIVTHEYLITFLK